MTNEELWQTVRECFEEDDGSLPGIELSPLTPAGLSAVYALLRNRSQMAGSEPATFWDRTAEQSISIDSVPDAAALVATGRADAFHHTIQGLRAAGVELPVLGLFVFPDSLEIDYRMGPEWGPAEVAGLFELLRDCCAVAPQTSVRSAEQEGVPDPTAFSKAWAKYSASRMNGGLGGPR